MKNYLALFLIVSVSLFIASCDLSGAFTQPTVQVNSYSLKELPGDNTLIDVNATITNGDSRSADLKSALFTVTLEGIPSQAMTQTFKTKLKSKGSLDLDLTISIPTNKAVGLLPKIEKGKSLDFKITGNFMANVPILGETKLPLDVKGKVKAVKGISDFFKQPSIVVNSYEVGEWPGDTVLLTVDLSVTNNDSKSATVKKITYIADIEGILSVQKTVTIDKMFPSGSAVNLTMSVELPTDGAALLLAKLDTSDFVNFHITGLFDIKEVDLGEFKLPLETSGSAKVIKGIDKYFSQPTVEVNSFKITQVTPIPNFPFPTSADVDLKVNITVTNKDIHPADISKVVYTTVIEGHTSQQETYVTPFTLKAMGNPGDSVILDDMLVRLKNVPVTFATKTTVHYTITGEFDVSTVLNANTLNLKLPLNVSGDASMSQ